MNTHNKTIPEENLLIIDGQDIILREFTAVDLDDLHNLTWQPEIHEYLPGWNVSREQRADWLLNYEIPGNRQFVNALQRGENIKDMYLRLAIISRQTGELIGWCCSGIKDELLSPNREIMYAISKDHRGKGYTTQAVQGMIMYLFSNTDLPLFAPSQLMGSSYCTEGTINFHLPDSIPPIKG
ncbi:GNAT family N-acetyltransferase [Paenibacillus sp. Z6-24]